MKKSIPDDLTSSSRQSTCSRMRLLRRYHERQRQFMSSPKSMIVVLALAHLLLALPFASPFAAAGSQSTPNPLQQQHQRGTASSHHHLIHRQQQQQQQRHQHPTAPPTTSWTPRSTLTTVRPMVSNDVTTLPEKKGRFQSLRHFVSRITRKVRDNKPNKNENDTILLAAKNGDWKGGESKASLLSRLFFHYTTPVLQTASERSLEPTDSFDIPVDERMDQAVSRMERIYHFVQQHHLQQQLNKAATATDIRKKEKNNNSKEDTQAWLLTQALFSHQRNMLIVTGILRLVNTAVQAFPAILIARLLRLIEAGAEHPPQKAMMAALTLVAVLTVKMVVENQYFHHVVKLSTQVRGALAGLIFDKSLRLPSGSSTTTTTTTTSSESSNNNNSNNVTDTSSSLSTSSLSSSSGAGAVLNLMQSDASIVEATAMQLHTLWDGPLQIAVYTSLLYHYLGKSVFWGIAVLLMTIPVNSIALRILNRLSKYENEAKDARTKRTAESIFHMKLLKLQGWEQHFAEDIRRHRNEELRRHVSRGLVRAINSAISNAVPSLVLVVTLTAYVKSGNPVVASTIFTAISLFNQLRFPLFFFPQLMDSLANGRNAMKRISGYLSLEEIVPYVQHLPPANGGSIEMRNGNFLWPSQREGSTAPALADVELKVNPGEVVAVVGTVGSGKSALIKGLLGELRPVPGIVVQQAISNRDEMPVEDKNSGKMLEKPAVISHGNVAYCSQEAWLPKGTIKDAILFGREYNEERYMGAIKDAGLDKDVVDEISAGENTATGTNGLLTHDTDVGEGGSSLSGGQRARVALARALYGGEDTKVYLLDDCLAALDANVGSTVFERLTKRLRGSNAAAVLVTNDPSVPRRCDRVIIMGNVPNSSSCSTVVDVGTYDELIARGHDLQSMSVVDAVHTAVNTKTSGSLEAVSTVVNSHHEEAHQHLNLVPKLTRIRGDKIRVLNGYSVLSNSTVDSCHADPECEILMENCPVFVDEQCELIDGQKTRPEDDGVFVDVYKANDTTAEIAPQFKGSSPVTSTGPLAEKVLSADDSMAVGAVPVATYIDYLKAVRKPLFVFAMLASYFLSNGAQFFQQYTVAKWTEVGGSAMASALNLKYMRQLVQAAGVVSISLWLRSMLTTEVGVRASEHLHSQMLNSVFKAPMSFFDATPSGQLLSRFGKEMQTVDRGVPDSISSVLYCFLQIFMSIGALAGVISPSMIIPMFAVGVLYSKAMSLFRPASRDLKRAETKTRSPIYTHFGEALRGTDTIRSIPGARHTWSKMHRSLTDSNLGVFYTVKALDRWLSTRLETLGNTVVLMAAVISVLLTRAERLHAGSAGWGLTSSLAITGLLTWAVRCLTDLETNMMGVMRVKELAQLPVQAPVIQHAPGLNTSLTPLDSTALIESGWPWRGNIQFRNVSMRYNPTSPLVLKNVTLTVPAGTTLGVVGRTGSGKSSLLLTLFRLAEIEDGRGSIEIDGVDIRSVKLDHLRQAIAPIPQDPVLFAGSVAYNLDATGRASPKDMWEALETASPSLASQFRRDQGLDTQISEGGKNLSLGQRQLICLARALLRKSKILVLDEATSSVDARTDQQVQDTIQREFVNKGVTVITVAHRLDTVLGYDKICVLGDGNVLEYGSPVDLLKDPVGELRSLVDADRRNKQKGALNQKDTIMAG